MLGRPQSWVLVLATSLVACQPEVTEVQLDRVDFDYAFPIFLDEAERPVRVGPLFGQIDGMSFGANAFDHRDGEAKILLVTMTEAALRRAVFDFDPSRALELSVEIGPPPSAPTFVSVSDGLPPARRAQIPGDAAYFLVDLDGQTVSSTDVVLIDVPPSPPFTTITLVVPVNPEFCRRRSQGPLVPFAAEANPITSLADAPLQSTSVEDLAWLDDDRVLVVGFSQLYVVRRGEAWRETPQTAYQLPADERFPFRRFHDAAVEPPGPDGRQVVWVSGGYSGEIIDRERLNAHGAVWKVTLNADGLQSVETATETPDSHVWTVHVASDGTVMAGGDDGMLIERRFGADRFTRLPSRRVIRTGRGQNWVNAIRSFEFDPIRWVVATQGLLHEYDASLDRWTEQLVLRDLVTAPELFEFFAIDGRLRAIENIELWAGASDGGLIRRAGLSSPWAQIQPIYPPRFEGCASALGPDDVQLDFRRAILDLALQDGFLYLAAQNCTAIVMLRLEDFPSPRDPPGCVSLLTEEAVAPGFTPAQYTALVSRPGELLVLRGDGRLLSSRWTP